jgi:hypothetical protein
MHAMDSRRMEVDKTNMCRSGVHHHGLFEHFSCTYKMVHKKAGPVASNCCGGLPDRVSMQNTFLPFWPVLHGCEVPLWLATFLRPKEDGNNDS